MRGLNIAKESSYIAKESFCMCVVFITTQKKIKEKLMMHCNDTHRHNNFAGAFTQINESP